MKKTLIIIQFILIPIIIFGQSPKTIDSKIKKVTVFSNGAQITRDGNITASNGRTTYIFKGLSPHIDKESIKVKSIGDFTILSIKSSINYLGKTPRIDSTTFLIDQINVLKEDRELLNVQQQILNEQISFLTHNKKVQSNENSLSPVDFKTYNLYFAEEYAKIKMDLFKTKRKIDKNGKEKAKLDKQYKNIINNKDLPTYEITIVTTSKKSIIGKIELNYYVNNAGWYPSYDIRVTSIEKPVNLAYKANLYQNTGVDWDNVTLIFSNATPTTSGNIPMLSPYYIGYSSYQQRSNGYISRQSTYQKKVNTYQGNNSRNKGNLRIIGTILEPNGDPAISANVVLQQDGVFITGVATDFDGNYLISGLKSGIYDIKTSYIGYPDQLMTGIQVYNNEQICDVTFSEGSGINLDEVKIVEYRIPVIQKDYMIQGQIVEMGTSRSNSNTKSYTRRNRKQEKQQKIELKTKKYETTFEFEMDSPYSVKADGKTSTIQIQHFELPTSYVFKSIPKINKKAYLIANITDWEKFNLLTGEVNLYYENTFIGKSLIDLSVANDTLAMSLGEDKNISIERIKEKQFSKRQFIGKHTIQNRVWKTTIRNNKSSKIKILIYDQIPVSQEKDIKIIVQNLSEGKLNHITGEVLWAIDIVPKSDIIKKLEFKVKHLKQLHLVME